MTKHYDPKTIAIFEAIGSYFVDIFYNGHYQLAVERVESGVAKSETDAYRAIIMSYMDGVGSRPDAYALVIGKLHSYYREACGFRSISFADFEDKLLSQMIPPDFYKSFTEANKDNALRGVINTVVQRFGEFAVSKDALAKVIDRHSAHEINVPYMQSKILNILFAQRDEYYVKFAKVISKRSGGRNVDVKYLDELEVRLQKANDENKHLQSELESAVRIISQLGIRIKQQDTELKKLTVRTQQPRSESETVGRAQKYAVVPRMTEHGYERYPARATRTNISDSHTDPRGRDRTESNLWNSSMQSKKIPKANARGFDGKGKEHTRIANNIDDSPEELPSADTEDNLWGISGAPEFDHITALDIPTRRGVSKDRMSRLDPHHRSSPDVLPKNERVTPIFDEGRGTVSHPDNSGLSIHREPLYDASDTSMGLDLRDGETCPENFRPFNDASRRDNQSESESNDSLSEDEDARADRLRRERTAKNVLSRSFDTPETNSSKASRKTE
jgi:hypothetical protein